MPKQRTKIGDLVDVPRFNSDQKEEWLPAVVRVVYGNRIVAQVDLDGHLMHNTSQIYYNWRKRSK